MTLKHLYLFFSLLLLTFQLAIAQKLEIDNSVWVTNGSITDIVRLGNTIYIAGEFSHVGPSTGSSVIIDQIDGKIVKTPFLKIDGIVRITISDGKGGWFLGGDFTRVQGVIRNNLAHILADGTLDQTWNPNVSGQVYALSLSGNVVYVGGYFTSIDGQTRNRLAALDATSGQLTPWNPNADGEMLSLVVSGSVVYVGGWFTNIGGQTRHHLAAIDVTTGQLTAWNPNVNGQVRTLSLSGNVIYVGGDFTSIDGQTRNRLAALDATDGQLTPWNPNAGASVYALAVSQNRVYVGGKFTGVGGQTRNNLAALDATSGQVTAWNPGANNAVYALTISGNVIYVGGEFTSAGGQTRHHLAAVDATSGQLTPWNPNAGASVYALAILGNRVYAGGSFTSVGGQTRNNLAAFDAITGQLTPWNPDLIGSVRALAVSQNKVYVGGKFTSVGGQTRNNLAAFDAITGQLTPWNPDAPISWQSTTDPNIYAVTVSGNMVYVGGYFTSISGQWREGLAAFDATTGQLTAWNPKASFTFWNKSSSPPWNPEPKGNVYALAVSGNVVYIGGSFTSIGGQTRNRLAALDATTGLATAWNPNPSGDVYALAVSGNVVYVGGYFSSIGGQPRNHLAAFDATTGLATAWNPKANGGVYALAISENRVYAGGNFTSISSQESYRLAALDATTGQITAWNSDKASMYHNLNDNSAIHALTVSENVIYVGGNFKVFDGQNRNNFAVFGRPVVLPNFIKGSIYEDTNGDCVRNRDEKGIANRVVVAQPGNYFASTDSSGNYTLRVDTGSYTIGQIIPSDKLGLIRQVCPVNPTTHTVSFTASNDTTFGKDFASQTTLQSYLTVNISSDRRRRCMTNTTTVSYCNSGTAEATDAKVYVKLPEYVVFKSASAEYIKDKDNNYVFSIGTLSANACGSISIQDSVICGNSFIRGLTQCTKAWITPANPTTPSANWDKSDIELKAKCLENGRVRLALLNKGEGSMADSSSFRIYLDTKLSLVSKYKLAKGDSLILQVPANGQTVRLEADQREGHPTKQQTNTTIEACGTNKEGNVSTGFVCKFPQDDAEPEVAIECLPIIDSFDPNDKLVSPTGVTENYYTPTNTALHYKIRFQNTGTDYAYKVVVVDTLSEHLDLSTLEIGNVSHPYKMSLSGKGKALLSFTFDNIMLPDSNRNEPQSHGYISFNIRPKKELAEKTRIDNFADIFFDYNEPIRTNITTNTIYDMPPLVAEEAELTETIICYTTNRSVDAGENRVICEKDTVALQALAPPIGKGRWKVVSGSAKIGEEENPYTVVSELAYGENLFEWSVASSTCGSDSLKAQVRITRMAKPLTPIITQVGADSLSCDVQGSSYEWQVDGEPVEGRTQRIKVSGNGNYTVRVTDEQGCSSDWSAPSAYLTTGLTIDLASQVEVYPNPSNGHFMLSFPASLGKRVQITITDALGRVVYEQGINNTDASGIVEEIDLSAASTGIYMIKLYTDKGMIVKKVLKR